MLAVAEDSSARNRRMWKRPVHWKWKLWLVVEHVREVAHDFDSSYRKDLMELKEELWLLYYLLMPLYYLLLPLRF